MRYVVSFPALDDADAHAIDAVRRQHDPQADWIGPHVTLAFALPLPEPVCVTHVQATAGHLAPARAVFRRAAPWWTGLGPAHVLLLPDEGLSTLYAWHDALYASQTPFHAHLRHDMPFVPHITLAAVQEPAAAARLAAAWNARELAVVANFAELATGALLDDPRRFDVVSRVALRGAT